MHELAMAQIIKFKPPHTIWPSGDANYLGYVEEGATEVSKKLGLPIFLENGPPTDVPESYFFLFYLEEIGFFTLFSETLTEGMTIAIDMGVDSFHGIAVVRHFLGKTLTIVAPH